MLSKIDTFGRSSSTGLLDETRLLAYNDVQPYGFSISSPHVVQRLTAIEESWVAGVKGTELDLAFWDACYERHHQPGTFVVREAYLSLAIQAQVATLTAEAEAKIGAAAEKAKLQADEDNSGIINAMNALGNMGITLSEDDQLALDIEKAMMEDRPSHAPATTTKSEAYVPVFSFEKGLLSSSAASGSKRTTDFESEPAPKRARRLPTSMSPRSTKPSSLRTQRRRQQSLPSYNLTHRPKSLGGGYQKPSRS
ncbi:hypothetical protein MMC16_004089 [Acarospora aff. strigata]|nr:hypothetical protein [Acarospora aff. strigata]